MTASPAESTSDAPRGADFAAGARDILPVLIAAAPFGLLLGTLSAQKGLSPAEVAVMSATVFAGGSQFIAIDLWAHPVPVLTLVVSTIVVNLRHVLMGAALAPHLGRFGVGHKAAAMGLLADEVWALAVRRAGERPLTPAYYAGLALPLWVMWVSTTTAGALIGDGIEDPARFGFDFAFAAIFLCLLVGLWQGARRSALPLAVAAATALAAHWTIPGVWYVFLGGLAGAITGALQPATDRAAADPDTDRDDAG